MILLSCSFNEADCRIFTCDSGVCTWWTTCFPSVQAMLGSWFNSRNVYLCAVLLVYIYIYQRQSISIYELSKLGPWGKIHGAQQIFRIRTFCIVYTAMLLVS
jgi:hypothetical protein